LKFVPQAEAKATRLIIIIIAILHAGLALTFKVLFFSYYVVEKIGVDIPLPGGDTPATNTIVALVRRVFTL
jgi:protein YIPF1/2